MIAYDSPLMYGEKYEARIHFLQEHIAKNEMVQVAKPIRVVSSQHMEDQWKEVAEHGGKGLLFRKCASQYMEPNSMLKWVVRNLN